MLRITLPPIANIAPNPSSTLVRGLTMRVLRHFGQPDWGLNFSSFVLDVHTPALLPEMLFMHLVLITLVCPYVTAGIGGVKHVVKVVGVVLFGGADMMPADQLVFPVSTTDTELVTVVAFAVFLYPAGFSGFLAALCICPFRRGFTFS